MKNLIKTFLLIAAAGLIASCEGPMGPAGADGLAGADGKDGKDVNESCKECHNSTVVEAKVIEYDHSVHGKSLLYEEEGGNTGCAPCHSHQGFLYVVKNNTPATAYSVNAAAATLPGGFTCSTCHNSMHTTYKLDDFFPLTTTAAVPLVMWGGTKTVNFAKNEGNLCTKCHQPRPVAVSGVPINYSLLVSAPTTPYTLSTISFRTGVHYGTQGVMAAGVGAVEFGTGYSNSHHVANASCSTCHMATPSATAGGHSFEPNFNGCNTTQCHTGMSATSALYLATTNEINTLTNSLVAKINAIGAGHDILQKDPDGSYHGYFDIYDANSNPTGYWRNPANGTPVLPALTNAQFGAIINFQLVVRGGAKGIHNAPYIKKLLENTIAAI